MPVETFQITTPPAGAVPITIGTKGVIGYSLFDFSFNLFSISDGSSSILENANHFLPRSFSEAPM